jgi:hypothetical protein
VETKRKKIENGVCKDAERQRVRGLESPSVFKPRLSDGLSYEGFMPSTGLKTRGYLTSRLSDGYFPLIVRTEVSFGQMNE